MYVTILDAAAHVFREKGFSGGTTNHIAEQAGVSVGSLYQYFPDKYAILAGLMEQHFADNEKRLSDILEKVSRTNIKPRETVQGLIEMMLCEQLIDPDLHRVLLEASLQSPAVLEMSAEVVKEAGRRVEGILGLDPRVRRKDTILASRLATLTGIVLTHWFVLFGKDEIEHKAFVDEVTDMLTRYIFR